MGFLDRIGESDLSRRGFLGATAAVAAGAALAGCSNKVEETGGETPVESTTVDSMGRDAVTGEWKTGACWHNCGGRCLNKVLVNDGVVIRQKTDDTHEDSVEFPQQRGCVRGRSQRKQVFAEDRLKYPMKRVNWSPENPNRELRGKDSWERIS